MINDQQQVHVAEIGFRRYFFWKRDQGICNVLFREDIDRLLCPKSGLSRYEVAYEKYGIEWDEYGNQKDSVSESEEQETVTVGSNYDSDSFTEGTINQVRNPKMSISDRIQKMRDGRNRARVARGLPPIDFNS